MDGNDDSRLEIIIHGACRIGQMVHRVWKLSSRVVHLIGAHINYAISIGGLYRCSTLDFRLPRLSQGEGEGPRTFPVSRGSHPPRASRNSKTILCLSAIDNWNFYSNYVQVFCWYFFFFNRSQILFNILIFNKYLVNM